MFRGFVGPLNPLKPSIELHRVGEAGLRFSDFVHWIWHTELRFRFVRRYAADSQTLPPECRSPRSEVASVRNPTGSFNLCVRVGAFARVTLP